MCFAVIFSELGLAPRNLAVLPNNFAVSLVSAGNKAATNTKFGITGANDAICPSDSKFLNIHRRYRVTTT